MFDVIIVDDEKLAREYFNSIIDWDLLGLNVCALAKDGQEAIELIEKHRPQIALIDLVMPTVDGIALSNYIRENNLDIEIIIISGLDSFDTARKIIKLNVRDYFLKPINIDELSTLLNKIVLELKAKQEDDNGIKLQLLKNAIYNNDYSQLSMISVSREDEIILGGCFCFQDNIKVDFLKLESRSEDLVIYKKDNNYFGFAILSNNDNLLNSINYIFKNTTSIIISEKCNIEISTQTANKIENCINDVLLYNSCVAKIKRDPLNNSQIYLNDIVDLEKLLFLVKTKKINKINEEINNILNILQSKRYSSQRIYSVLNSFISYLETFIKFDNSYNEKWYIHKSFNQIKTNLLALVKESFENIETDPIPTTRKGLVVKEAINIVKDNLSNQNLSISFIACKCNVTSSYIRKTFKEIMGITINNYIIESRFDKAKEYLKTGYYIHAEIAEKVGYKDAAYFSRSFKKTIGMSPKEYEIFASNS